ncbi:hypothetical protein [Photobacterium leiognathi]|nr:hypothetical protein [Photobacterium leiognathi]
MCVDVRQAINVAERNERDAAGVVIGRRRLYGRKGANGIVHVVDHRL